MEQERAQLWAVYWSLRALRNPSPPLLQAQQHLRERLNPRPSSPKRSERSHLQAVDGQGGRR